MAIVTKTLGVFRDAAGNACTFEFDFDNVALRLTTVRCVNNTAQPASITATVTKNGRTRTLLCPANATTPQSIPTSAAQRFDVTVDARGRVDGVEYQLAWPAV